MSLLHLTPTWSIENFLEQSIDPRIEKLCNVSLKNMSLGQCKCNQVISPDKIRNERVPCIFFFIKITCYIILKTYEPRREKTGLLGFRPGATQKQAR